MAPLAPSKQKHASKIHSRASKPQTSSILSKSNTKSSAALKRNTVTTQVIASAASDSGEDEENEDEEQTKDESKERDGKGGVYLQGFSTDEDSSDDDGDDVPEIPGIDVTKLPTVAKDDATVKRKLERAKREPTRDRGVLYLGRIPHGFYEDEMKAYFSQFGNITRLRISRNKKTGKSKHYGFIEFDSASVAQIVSETMDNYLLMGHILQCKVIPNDQVHPELWMGANRKWRKVPRDRVHRIQHNKPRTEEQRKRAESKLLKKQVDRQAKIRAAGINYDIGAAGYRVAAVAK
ncbi:RNA-binding protein [Ceratobasidium theobromae]|uniref:RNA-binding protein n=1 Tax=Ceratobasidium theobromae TaxID=1582974 RepID=A0A5N5QJV3_9AGAM|nr:RNA-binding protein [Ceratobasidium theobromae]